MNCPDCGSTLIPVPRSVIVEIFRCPGCGGTFSYMEKNSRSCNKKEKKKKFWRR